jgi:hypothetical protein
MEWFTPSDSKCVKRAGYDLERRELHIVYESGRHYVYRQAPAGVFRHMQEIDRAGHSLVRFVDWVIKPVFRDYREVDDKQS